MRDREIVSARRGGRRAWLRGTMALLGGLAAGPLAFAQKGASAPIVIGRSASLTGPGAAFGAPASAGARAWFEHVNARGGIQGRPIELVELDDGFDMQRMLDNTRRLLDEHKAQALFLYFGTPLVMRAIELAEQERVPLVAPVSWSDALRATYRSQTFPVRPSVSSEARAIVDQLGMLSSRRVALVYQDDGVGRSAVAALGEAFKRAGLAEPLALPMVPGAPDAAWVDRLLGQRPDAVVLAGYAGNTLPAIAALRARTKALPLLAMSTVTDTDLATLGEGAAGVMNSQPFPHPLRSHLPVALEFRQLMAKHQPQVLPNYAAMEGFLAAKVMTEALERCGGDVSRARIAQALESLRTADLGGYSVSYSPQAHAGASFVELLVLDRRGRLMR